MGVSVHALWVWWTRGGLSWVITLDAQIKSIIAAFFNKHSIYIILTLFLSCVSFSHCRSNQPLLLFQINLLNITRWEKRADGWDNGADSQPVYTGLCVKKPPHTSIRVRTHLTSPYACNCMNACTPRGAQILKTDQDGVDNETASDPVHLWSTVHYPNGRHSLLLIIAPLSLSTLVVFHLVTFTFICIGLLIVSPPIDGTINRRLRLTIIAAETIRERTSRPWKP